MFACNHSFGQVVVPCEIFPVRHRQCANREVPFHRYFARCVAPPRTASLARTIKLPGRHGAALTDLIEHLFEETGFFFYQFGHTVPGFVARHSSAK